ncbi:MAG: NIL domain-containing protein [Capsulimonadaceae bacterium]|nr:NIL domain-containing protein [Capsulimonadaceae bacterium]
MAVEQYNLTFNSAMEDRPILANLTKKYNLSTVLRKAQLSESAGWVQVAFHGDRDEIQRALTDLMTQGVMVTPVHLNTLSGEDTNPLP